MKIITMRLTEPHRDHAHRAGWGFHMATWANHYDLTITGTARSRRLARAKLRARLRARADEVSDAMTRAR
jgi:hypothetical protein